MTTGRWNGARLADLGRCLCALVIVLACPSGMAHAEPGPGDIFKEFAWTGRQLIFGHPSICTHPSCPHQTPPTRSVSLDLENATRAELVVSYWSGHVGTSQKSLSFNGNDWINVPLPQNTAGSPECYYAVVSQPAVDLPLSHLRDGNNNFTFRCLEQICHDFQYPAWAVHAVIVRVYYAASKPHASGTISSPQSGARLGDATTIEVNTTGSVDRVELLGEYEGFDWEGNGVARQWHSRYSSAELRRHLGTAQTAPYRVTWDSSWVPEQVQPMRLMARVVASNGIVSMTPIVDNLDFSRTRSVRMYGCDDLPKNFSSRVNQRKTCNIVVNDDLSSAVAARMIVSTGAPHEEPGEMGLNDTSLAVVPAGSPSTSGHRFFDVEVPVHLLTDGQNEFYFVSSTEHHAMEVNLPGPILLVEYPGSAGGVAGSGGSAGSGGAVGSGGSVGSGGLKGSAGSAGSGSQPGSGGSSELGGSAGSNDAVIGPDGFEEPSGCACSMQGERAAPSRWFVGHWLHLLPNSLLEREEPVNSTE